MLIKHLCAGETWFLLKAPSQTLSSLPSAQLVPVRVSLRRVRRSAPRSDSADSFVPRLQPAVINGKPPGNWENTASAVRRDRAPPPAPCGFCSECRRADDSRTEEFASLTVASLCFVRGIVSSFFLNIKLSWFPSPSFEVKSSWNYKGFLFSFALCKHVTWWNIFEIPRLESGGISSFPQPGRLSLSSADVVFVGFSLWRLSRSLLYRSYSFIR